MLGNRNGTASSGCRHGALGTKAALSTGFWIEVHYFRTFQVLLLDLSQSLDVRLQRFFGVHLWKPTLDPVVKPIELFHQNIDPFRLLFRIAPIQIEARLDSARHLLRRDLRNELLMGRLGWACGFLGCPAPQLCLRLR